MEKLNLEINETDDFITKSYITKYLGLHGKYVFIRFINNVILLLAAIYVSIGFIIIDSINLFHPIAIVILCVIFVKWMICLIVTVKDDRHTKRKLADINYAFQKAWALEKERDATNIASMGMETFTPPVIGYASKVGTTIYSSLLGMDQMDYIVTGIKNELEAAGIDADERGNYIMPFYKLHTVFLVISIIAFCISFIVCFVIFKNQDLNILLKSFGITFGLTLLLAVPFTLLLRISYLDFVFTSLYLIKSSDE